MNHEVVMSISRRNLTCDEIVLMLQKAKVYSYVVPTKSVINYGSEYMIENGCQIHLFNQTKPEIESLWNKIKTKNDLQCAHLMIPNTFNGCVYDYLSKSKCPGNS